jgi:Raf kinase inhibitor-like YbhB/YbcL family protein
MQESIYTFKYKGKFKFQKIFLSSILSLFLLISLITTNFNVCSSVFATSKEVSMSTVKEISVSSSAFKQGQRIPTQYTADGANVSPPLSWGTPPAGTKSFALICEDPDAPAGTWIHWIVYDIPANKTELPQGVSAQKALSDGTKQGITSFHRVGYGGPSPPPGKPHRYFFRIYALNSMSGLEPGIDLAKFNNLVRTHKIAEAEIMGTYGR